MRTEFSGRLRLEDMQRHIPHRLRVPEGTAELRAVLEHSPKHPGAGPIPHEIALSLEGPDGLRGARHNNPDQSFRVTDRAATPGFLPGLRPGLWTVWIDTHRIQPPGGIDYRLTVEALGTTDLAPQTHRPAATAPRGPGWYRGDLHGHTNHTDGRFTVAEFAADCRAQGLDFAVLSDHNTTSPLAEYMALAGDDLLAIPGQELTTFRGHALSIGLDTPLDWRVHEGTTMADVARAHLAAGAWFVIAHPMAPGHPWCSGCNWQYTDVMPGPAPAVEIWNGPWGPENALGLDLFRGWLNDGHRLVATAGSDTHGPGGRDRCAANVTQAEALSRPAILAALRAGRTYLTTGPELVLAAGDVPMGGTAPRDAQVAVRWSGAPSDARLRLVRGAPPRAAVEERPAGPEGHIEVPLDAPWIMAELWTDSLLAVTNPIFADAGPAAG